MQSLSEVAAGEACTVKWMIGDVQMMNSLRRYHVKERSQIQVLRQYGGGTIVRLDDHRLALGYEVAERIKV